jgi:hypothetical protein
MVYFTDCLVIRYRPKSSLRYAIGRGYVHFLHAWWEYARALRLRIHVGDNPVTDTSQAYLKQLTRGHQVLSILSPSTFGLESIQMNCKTKPAQVTLRRKAQAGSKRRHNWTDFLEFSLKLSSTEVLNIKPPLMAVAYGRKAD